MSDPPNRSSRGRGHRYSHRSRHHDSAHAEADPPAARIPDHPLIPRGPAALIATIDAFQELIAHLREVKRFGYDSEFIGELTYHPRLCLIQVATEQRVALIDPLAELDLTPFWELLCDPSIEKIVHAGMQDLEPAVRLLQRSCANVFDTQIAAGFCGMTYPVSLSKIVQELVGAKLGKGLTFSHWDQRPLSAMQLRYAADDVRFLPVVHERLCARLDERGHRDWAQEESQSLCDASNYGFDPDAQYLRVRGATSLTPQGLAVLRELTIWRDAAARAHDVPPRTFLKDEVLAELARAPVKQVQKLARIRGLPRPVEAEHGVEIVAATNRALALPADAMPPARVYEPAPSERFAADALWCAAQVIAAGHGIDPALVTNRQEVIELYRHFTEPTPFDHLRVMSGWRRQAVGDPLLRLVRENRRLVISWTDGKLHTEM